MQTAGTETFAMEFDWGALVGAGAAIVAAAGATIRWIITRMDKMHEADRQWDANARDKVENALTGRIAALHTEFDVKFRAQAHEVEFLKSELHRYIKHVGVLEGILKSHDIDIPAIEPPALRGVR